jgi:hypothetical protein
METKLTSVKVISELYNKFRKITLDEKLTFQQLVNRSINLYVSDDKFKTSINEFKSLQSVSGSQF